MALPPDIRVHPLNESPGFIIHRMDTLLGGGLSRSFAAHGHAVTPEQWAVLNRLWEEEGPHQNELAERLAKDKHNTARILKLLERDGFIIRKSDPNDRRLQKIFLSETGRNLKGRLIPIAMDYVEQCFAGLSAEEIETMLRCHEKIIANAEGVRRKLGKSLREET